MSEPSHSPLWYLLTIVMGVSGVVSLFSVTCFMGMGVLSRFTYIIDATDEENTRVGLLLLFWGAVPPAICLLAWWARRESCT